MILKIWNEGDLFTWARRRLTQPLAPQIMIWFSSYALCCFSSVDKLWTHFIKLYFLLPVSIYRSIYCLYFSVKPESPSTQNNLQLLSPQNGSHHNDHFRIPIFQYSSISLCQCLSIPVSVFWIGLPPSCSQQNREADIHGDLWAWSHNILIFREQKKNQ